MGGGGRGEFQRGTSQEEAEETGSISSGGSAGGGSRRPAKSAEDGDSGIAINIGGAGRKSRFLEKKSIFTIAYDDVATARIPSSSDNLIN